MTILVALQHRTTYTFDRPVTVHPHTVRLRPAPHSRTPVTAYSLTVHPSNHFVNWQQDPFGNHLARLVFPERVTELDVTVDLVADLTVINPFDFFVEDYAEHHGFAYPPELRSDLDPYLRPVDEGGPGSGPGVAVRAFMAEHGLARDPAPGSPQEGIVDLLVRVNAAVAGSVAYSVRMDPGVLTPDTTLARGIGSCRDSAWLLVAVLREMGLAARFVSGYLVQLVADQAPTDGGASGPSADFTDLHAWAEVYLPGAGWIGLDATSGLLAGEGHIPLSATPTPASSAPISGATEPAEVTFSFSNTVTRLHEDPRVTRPYDDDQWAAVDALGEHVDALLRDGDVRLTMGGEPTFVATDHAAPEWNTTADGPAKRERAEALARRLLERWAPGGLVHHGQGKWYPGEELPRWAIQLTWRRDGAPVWHDPALRAWPWSAPTLDRATLGDERVAATVQAVALEVAARLGVPAGLCLPAHEDPFAVQWDLARRPPAEGEGAPEGDLAPDDASASAPVPAAVDAADESAGTPRGWVLPLFEDAESGGWGTTAWRPRRRHLFLVPGTSPLGMRLPLDSLAWGEPPLVLDRSPYEPRGPLAAPDAVPQTPPAPAVVRDVEEAPRTALAVEERAGHLCVFLPPVVSLDRGLELVAAVESAAAAVGVPVVVEGYPLPGDERVTSLSVTPDPGVIEVNVQPTASWAELRDLTTSLDEDARACGLATEKFDLDGSHTGTGGGSHLTLGGSTPAESPLLRRPDVLRSLITYWQHHPSLSYVFSGRFVGPTSQAPRVDEARPERLYELETAFAELERASTPPAGAEEGWTPPPWLADRLLRHLLTDLTGNTHRSEFCIDKLYDPGTDRGRLGLLELRGFEMPPHPRMALVQALLVRALVARFWAEPYSGPLVRWGTRLHDRFLLPATAEADLLDVVADLNRFLERAGGPGGARFDPDWLGPFLEFRFPRLGSCTVAGVELELRQGVEPWHVLGEEIGLGGTTRYVDSSVERLQVGAVGLVPGRHVLTCNGVPVPLVPASEPGRVVGGVRYRAWAPYSALHPTIGVHAPLVFDLVDTWQARSLGGFTHHVVHPGGRSYETPPVNAMEAEARRSARFRATGMTGGPVHVPPVPPSWGSPEEDAATLDLRRHSPGRHPADHG